jgi:2-keto-4-pentenoate hydratase/2-oxohepta-3-ene-1,7-dioic acid hydratase in catechol pathway
MKLANHDGRLCVVQDEGLLDVHEASGGRFPAEPAAAFDQWDELVAWVPSPGGTTQPIDPARLGPPSPSPRQIFAIGLNYHGHAAESGQPAPEFPPTFTKFPTCLTGADAVVALPSEFVDWEVELVVVIGRSANQVAEGSAWSHVAGLTVGQDLSERLVQLRPPVPQFSLGKSFPGFGPVGPWLVTPDELDHPDDLVLECSVDGETMQKARTSDLIFSVPELIARLSSVTPLLPGDLVFTGTPSGVGGTRTPPRFLAPDDVLVSSIEGIGTIRTRFTSKEQA